MRLRLSGIYQKSALQKLLESCTDVQDRVANHSYLQPAIGIDVDHCIEPMSNIVNAPDLPSEDEEDDDYDPSRWWHRTLCSHFPT